ncbi:unnamed protein product [Larinioides sclopetarius]|uniref:Uncharacterized protein n=1 Tax=Larinioides sclopetarius TaxID=280406 RepID=A0AAV2BHG4_9ARAC
MSCMLTLKKKAVPGSWVFPNTCSSFQKDLDGKREVLKPRFLGPGIVSIKDASLVLLVKAGQLLQPIFILLFPKWK